MNYRERIIEKASKMFSTYGIRAVTMDMLAGQMNISKRTIYEVLSDKDELLRGVLEWMAVKQKERTAEIMKSSDNVIAVIFRIIDLMMDHFQKVSPAFLMYKKSTHLEAIENAEKHNKIPYVGNNYEILKKGVEQGIFRDDINIEPTKIGRA
jgi:AcrR family transcriptional regulator